MLKDMLSTICNQSPLFITGYTDYILVMNAKLSEERNIKPIESLKAITLTNIVLIL